MPETPLRRPAGIFSEWVGGRTEIETKGNQTQAAKLLKISYRSLRHRLQVLKIRKEKK